MHRAAQADALVVAAWTDHHEEVFAFLVRTTRDPEVAEDLLQEAYLRLTPRSGRTGRPTTSGPGSTAWAPTSRSAAVGASRPPSGGSSGSAAPGRRPRRPTPEAGYLAREGRADLLGLLADLDPDARAALLLSAEGFSGAEIAAAIGRSEAATRTLLCRTRVRVRSRLESAEAVR